MVRVRARAKSEYEALRNARMLEIQARLESLGVLNSISQLRQASSQRKKTRQHIKRVYGLTPLRRSQRLTAATNHPLRDSSTHPLSPKQEKVTLCEGEEEKKRPANAPLVKLRGVESSAQCCNSKGRGSIYNPVLGICCHFCRQKKLCGEEDCKRCGNFVVDEPCLGKTDCSVCHSSTGVFCRACLKVRYGEEIEEVRENKGWMCPHCMEAKGIKPYGICNRSLEEEKESIRMVRLRARAKSEYEALRNARVLENQARLESLGVLNSISKLRQASAERKKTHHYIKRVYSLTPLRRSQRITVTATSTANYLPLPRSLPLRDSSTHPLSPKQEVTLCEVEEEKTRPANAPLVKLRGVELQISAESSAQRCNSKGRGSIYNPVLGICCHFCRQKKLCGEEDGKRCGNFDVNEPCLGKTDCSVCHSSTGVLCRACLKVRYGEEIEEVRENKGWMCPHCIEAKGIKPYWICNSSICLRKRKIPPTGLAIYRAREMGYKSVAHLLMEELKRGNMLKR